MKALGCVLWAVVELEAPISIEGHEEGGCFSRAFPSGVRVVKGDQWASARKFTDAYAFRVSPTSGAPRDTEQVDSF